MNHSTVPVSFKSVAAALAANGYRPVPIKPGLKHPGFDRWELFTYKAGCESRFPNYGAGIILGEVVGVDIDVDDPDAAAAIETAVREIAGLGDAAEIPRRIGKAPRVLLPFRTATAFRKLVTAQYRLRIVPDGKPAKVEVLANGQQFVAYALHPDTREPYIWNGGGDLLAVPIGSLPELTEQQAREIVRQSEEILAEWGERIGEASADAPAGEPGADIPDGARDDTLYRMGRRMHYAHFDEPAILAALAEYNASHCKPPKADREIRRIAHSCATGKDRPGDDAPGDGTTSAIEWPAPLDLEVLAGRTPQKPRFILADWLPIGYATLLAGHGGVGKSAIGLHLAVCVAMGLPFFGIATERRRVLYLSCEDREGILHWRLAHICAWLGLNMAELAGHLDVRDLVGHDTVLWERDPKTGHTITPAFDRLASCIERTRSGLLIVDGVSDTFGGNENARTEVKRYVNALLSLLTADEALLLLGHIAKMAATNADTTEGYSGSTQWHNAVRARWYLYPETEKDEKDRPRRTGKLLLELQKSNLGPIDQAMTFSWDDEARLFLASGTYGTSAVDREHREETDRAGVLAALRGCVDAQPPIAVPTATRGERTAFHVLSNRPEFPESLKRSTRRFWACIEQLRQLHHIEEQENRRSGGKKTWHFVVTAEGMRQFASY